MTKEYIFCIIYKSNEKLNFMVYSNHKLKDAVKYKVLSIVDGFTDADFFDDHCPKQIVNYQIFGTIINLGADTQDDLQLIGQMEKKKYLKKTAKLKEITEFKENHHVRGLMLNFKQWIKTVTPNCDVMFEDDVIIQEKENITTEKLSCTLTESSPKTPMKKIGIVDKDKVDQNSNYQALNTDTLLETQSHDHIHVGQILSNDAVIGAILKSNYFFSMNHLQITDIFYKVKHLEILYKKLSNFKKTELLQKLQEFDFKTQSLFEFENERFFIIT